ncbi:MAG TPA: trimethylamine methyltransferase family protein [Clostridiales bacterium]|nr:trimethylamine methyltransferase family protein [Clostridiales bacterium]
MNMRLSYAIGTDNEVDLIHETSIKILEEVGAAFHSPKAVELFKRHGAKVDGEVVYITRAMLEDALNTVPKTYRLYDREGDYITIGDGDLKYDSTDGPIFIRKEGTYGPTTHEDLVNFHKLSETSKVISISNPNIIDFSYVKPTIRNQYGLGVALRYCKKPMHGMVLGGRDVVEECFKNMQDFYGIYDKPIMHALTCTVGPMQLAKDICEAMDVLCTAGQPCTVVSGVMLGASGPQTMAGAYTIGNAMVLAAIVYSQLLRPGTPILYCTRFSSHEMRTMGPAYGGIEAMWACATSKRMADFYSLPLQSGVGTGESKVLDIQCGAECFMNALSPHLLKADIMNMACGPMDTMNTMCYEKFIWDEEDIMKCRHLMKGYDVTEETLRFDEIKKKGPTGSYLGRTLPIYRKEFFEPKFDVRDIHNNWVKNGEPVCEELLTAEWKKRIEEYEFPDLSDGRRKIIEKLLPEAYHKAVLG